MTKIEQRCYRRARGPICLPGDPIKELPVPSVTGDKHIHKTWHSHCKEGADPVTPIADIPGKDCKMNYIL